MMERRSYDSDISNSQWVLIEPFMPQRKKEGRPPANQREVLNAILYVLENGIKWRALPHDFPAWQTVYKYFLAWTRDGRWKQIHDALRAEVRQAAGKEPTPSLGILDSQTTKTSELADSSGFDGGKKNQRTKATFAR